MRETYQTTLPAVRLNPRNQLSLECVLRDDIAHAPDAMRTRLSHCPLNGRGIRSRNCRPQSDFRKFVSRPNSEELAKSTWILASKNKFSRHARANQRLVLRTLECMRKNPKKKPVPTHMSFQTRSFSDLKRTEHGGDIRLGKRKLARPFDPRRPLHVVLRSERATGEWSLRHRRHERAVRDLLNRIARRAKVRVYQFANAGNHLHLILRARSRKLLAWFLRVACGLLARLITGARRGAAARFPPLVEGEPYRRAFWAGLVYSRVLEWGRAFRAARDYVRMNDLEATPGFGNLGRRSQRVSSSGVHRTGVNPQRSYSRRPASVVPR